VGRLSGVTVARHVEMASGGHIAIPNASSGLEVEPAQLLEAQHGDACDIGFASTNVTICRRHPWLVTTLNLRQPSANLVSDPLHA